MTDNSDKKTVIKPRPAQTKAAPSMAPEDGATIIKKIGPSLDTDQARALTKIGKSFKASDSSTGFDKARA